MPNCNPNISSWNDEQDKESSDYKKWDGALSIKAPLPLSLPTTLTICFRVHLVSNCYWTKYSTRGVGTNVPLQHQAEHACMTWPKNWKETISATFFRAKFFPRPILILFWHCFKVDSDTMNENNAKDEDRDPKRQVGKSWDGDQIFLRPISLLFMVLIFLY